MDKYGRKWTGIKSACSATRKASSDTFIALTYYPRLDSVISGLYFNKSDIPIDNNSITTVTDHPLNMQQIIDRFMMILNSQDFESYLDG